MNLFLFGYSLSNPFERKGMYVLNSLGEICLFFAQGIIQVSNEKNSYSMSNGRLVIYFLGSVLILDMGMIFYETICVIKEFLTKKKKKTNIAKVEDISKIELPPT